MERKWKIMSYGIVKLYDTNRGFGFIEEGRREIFVHKSNLELEDGEWIEEGMVVSYETVAGAKGTQAIHVKIVEKEEARKWKDAQILVLER